MVINSGEFNCILTLMTMVSIITWRRCSSALWRENHDGVTDCRGKIQEAIDSLSDVISLVDICRLRCLHGSGIVGIYKDRALGECLRSHWNQRGIDTLATIVVLKLTKIKVCSCI